MPGQIIVTDEALNLALSQAEPRGPAGLPEPDPGAVLALACHCILVDCDLKCLLPGATSGAVVNKWAPHPRWSQEFKDEWVFKYNATGKCNTLVLHCSLHRGTSRMLVHTTEMNSDRNSHLLGLQLDRYVPDASLLRGRDWTGVTHHGAALAAMMRQHVVAPLLEAAQDIPPGDAAFEDAGVWAAGAVAAEKQGAWWRWVTGAPGGAGGSPYVVPAVLVTGVAVAALAWYLSSRNRR